MKKQQIDGRTDKANIPALLHLGHSGPPALVTGHFDVEGVDSVVAVPEQQSVYDKIIITSK